MSPLSRTDVNYNGRITHLPGLDGIRALAVIAVLFYHIGFNVYGGFLGVESFFAVSGFLITALLLVEWQHHGKIDLRSFWLRRARRLLPAMFLVLAATAVAGVIFMPEEAAALRSDIVASLVYVMNWHLIGTGQSYFDAFARPSLLQHLWSLAVVNGKGQYNMRSLEYGLGLMSYRLPVGPGPTGATRPAEASQVFGHIGGLWWLSLGAVACAIERHYHCAWRKPGFNRSEYLGNNCVERNPPVAGSIKNDTLVQLLVYCARN